MTEKSEALRLAEWIESDMSCDGDEKIVAELRRLSAENEALRRERDEARRTVREAHEAGTRLTAQRDQLLEALKQIEPILARMYGSQAAELPPMQIVHTAIKSVEGE